MTNDALPALFRFLRCPLEATSHRPRERNLLRLAAAVSLVIGLAVPATATAQSLGDLDLSPPQQRMLQNLPSDQRQQLLDKIRQRQSQQQSGQAQADKQAEDVEKRRQRVAEKAKQQYKQASPIEQRLRQRLQAPSGREGQIQPTIKQNLQQYGYDLFQGPPSSFAPVTDIPVPAHYTVGPGDTIEVLLYGQKNANYRLTIDRDGQINFPEIGPLSVAGKRFDEVKELIKGQVASQFIGVKASVTMGPLRSIRVFVLGDVVSPGSYTVSSLSTLTNALLASGGVKRIGSLRNIALKRQGREITTLDLYELLLEGDTSNDVRLQPGDVIHVPPIGPTVGVAGQVLRPAIYELEDRVTIGGVLDLAGGLNPSADQAHVRLHRRTPSGEETVADLDLAKESVRKQKVRGGDVLRVYSAPARMTDVVFLKGNVRRPGAIEWRPGMRLTDAIGSVAGDLLPRPDLDYVLVKREVGPSRDLKAFSVKLGKALAAPDSKHNIELRPRDEILVFKDVPLTEEGTKRGQAQNADQQEGSEVAKEQGLTAAGNGDRTEVPGELDEQGKGGRQNRRKLIDPILDQLTQQSRKGEPAPVVRVAGQVRAPGSYPLEQDMRLADLIRAGAGLEESAYGLQAELTRYSVVDGRLRETRHMKIDLAAVLEEGGNGANVQLKPHDFLHVKRIPDWRAQAEVEIHGEVRFPGTYSIKQGETLTEVISRAGGVTKQAYLDGAVFTRERLKEKERERLEDMTQRLQKDLATLSLSKVQQDPEKAKGYAALQNMLDELKDTKAVGRMSMDLPAILKGKRQDVTLKDGDELYIPEPPQEVTVMGEVQFPTSHLFRPSLTREDYISKSGGTTARADDGRTYVIHANGEVATGSRSGWFSRSGGIKPGDTIIVPLNADYIRPLDLATNVTQIVYQLGIAAASWKTVGAF